MRTRPTLSQEAFFAEWQRAPQSLAYNIGSIYRLRGSVDVTRLAAAITATLEHEHVLACSRFEEEAEQLWLKLQAHPARVSIEQLHEGELAARIETLTTEPFDLLRGPLYRAVILETPGESVFVFDCHHAVFDGVTHVDFCAAIARHYRASEPSTHPSQVPLFVDFMKTERLAENEASRARACAHFAERLRGVPLSVTLTGGGRPAAGSASAHQYHVLPEPLSRALGERARELGSTLFRAMASLFGGLLLRYVEEDRFVLAHTLSVRPPELKGFVGCFTQTQPLVIEAGPASTFRELLRSIDTQRRNARQYSVVGLAPISAALADGGSGRRFNVCINESPGWLRRVSIDLPGIEVTPQEPPRGESAFDLELTFAEHLGRLTLRFDHRLEFADEAFVESLAVQFERLAEAFVRDPDARALVLPLTGPAERAHLAAQLEATLAEIPAASIDAYVRGHAERFPDRVAISMGERSMTYAELDARTNAIAAELVEVLSRQPTLEEPLVGVLVTRGFDLVASLLAVLRAGAAYVPLEPEFPSERLVRIANDASPVAIIGDAPSRARHPELARTTHFIDLASVGPPTAPVDRTPSRLAYVMYTSGSTGEPKGVRVTRRAVANFLASMARFPGLGPEDVVLALTTPAFDISVLELFLPLVEGARLEMVPTPATKDAFALQELLERAPVTVMQATPATWSMLLTVGWPGNKRLRALCGGEALPPQLAEALRPRVGALFNMFGPTETTVWSSVSELNTTGPITIGGPIANTSLCVLDRFMNAVPHGMVGELFIGGEGLAEGYHRAPELTARRFLDLSLFGTAPRRVFKTGDLARVLPSGEILCLGRIDTQVKLRGYRIELGEIESRLRARPEVRDVAVVLRSDAPGPRLVGYVVPVPQQTLDTEALLASLREALPAYMVPSELHTRTELPLTGSGKVDRKRLSEMPSSAARPAPADAGDGSRRKLYQRLVECASAVLGRPLGAISGSERLGSLGFDSLSFTRFAVRLTKELGVRVQPNVFYEASSLGQLAEHLAEKHPGLVQAAPPEPGPEPRREEPAMKPEHPFPGGADPRAVAIIGAAGRFPGADDLDELWSLLVSGRSAVGRIPADRWNSAALEGEPSEGFYSNCAFGGFLRDVRGFDAAFFGIQPREARAMDPRQRLLVETAWHALEDAGISAAQIAGSRTGVYVGALGSDYWELASASNNSMDGYAMSGIAASILANRLSYFFDLHGPSFVVDTACSSSLVALVRAVEALELGRIDQAIVAGVNVILSPAVHVALSKNGMLSPDGRCRTFDAEANGYVRGEGVVVLVLRPLARAEANGDRLHAIIRGAADNHGGRANNLATPSTRAQAAVLREAIERSGVDPSTIGYVEAHGTGTRLGDPIEMAALEQALGKAGSASKVAVGSLKTNLGHLEAAAGLASVAKVLLAFRHRLLPGLVGFEKLNPFIELGSRLQVLEKNVPWEPTRPGVPLRAGVSSFGFGGANAHVILEAPPEAPPSARQGLEVILLSAKSASALEARAAALLAWLERHPDASLGDIAYSLRTGRDHWSHRLAALVGTTGELLQALHDVRAGRTHHAVLRSETTARPKSSRAQRAFSDFVREKLSGEAPLDEERAWLLAELYVEGFELSWEGLVPRGGARRLGLPGYPFERRPFWFMGENKVRHGLLSEPTRGEVHSMRLDITHPLANEHRVDGTPLLPGVGTIELVREAAARLDEELRGGVTFEDVLFLRPIVATGEGTLVSVRFDAPVEGGRVFRVFAEGVEAARGTVRSLRSESETLDVQELNARLAAGPTLESEELQARLLASGLSYGPLFRGLRRWTGGPDMACGEVRRPREAERGSYLLDPRLMDAAMQALVLFNGERERPLVPFAVERLEFFRPLSDTSFVRVQRQPGSRYQVQVHDERGQLAVRLEGVEARVLKPNAPPLVRPPPPAPVASAPPARREASETESL